MKKVIFIFAFVTALFLPCRAGAAEAPPETCPRFDPAWQACSDDSECVVGKDSCGSVVGYNRESRAAAEKWSDCARAQERSCPGIASTIHGDPRCASGICSLGFTMKPCLRLDSGPFPMMGILPWSLTLAVTLFSYGAYRRFRPAAPPHHKRFLWAAALLPLPLGAAGYFLYGAVQDAMFPKPKSGVGLQLSDLAIDAVLWVLCCGFFYMCYRMVMKRVPQESSRWRIAIGVFILMVALSVYTVYTNVAYSRWLGSSQSFGRYQC